MTRLWRKAQNSKPKLKAKNRASFKFCAVVLPARIALIVVF
jgi:hypothetical protein